MGFIGSRQCVCDEETYFHSSNGSQGPIIEGPLYYSDFSLSLSIAHTYTQLEAPKCFSFDKKEEEIYNE
jgi:hypothetical protein